MWRLIIPILACYNDGDSRYFEDRLVRAYNDGPDPATVIGGDAGGINIPGALLALIAAAILLLALWRLGRKARLASWRWRLGTLVGAFFLGGIVLIFCTILAMLRWPIGSPVEPPVVLVPLPHNIGPRADGLSLRLSLIRDTLHERYEHHGPAYYEDRVRRAEAVVGDLEALADPDDAVLAAMDDLSVALDHLGRGDEAIAVQRRKAAWAGDAYTTHANLGTHLVHRYMREAMAGDAKARAQVQAGLAELRRAVEVNPDAHFGREQWQIAMIEGLLAAAVTPSTLATRTVLGQELPEGRADAKSQLMTGDWPRSRTGKEVAEFLEDEANRSRKERAQVRDYHVPYVKTRRANTGWDEPMLGLIGMWQMGGGPNPHSALCMATLLEGVGELELAWAGYQRALDMADGYWPDPKVVAALRTHCESRQSAIEAELHQSHAEMLAAFQAELQLGRDWQAAMATYEAERIAAGGDPREAEFYADFQAQHGAITSATGDYDRAWTYDSTAGNQTEYYPLITMFALIFGLVLLGLSLTGPRLRDPDVPV